MFPAGQDTAWVASRLRHTQFAQCADDFGRFGVAPLAVLGKNHGVVRRDVENSAAAAAQFGFHAQRCGKVGCQTGSPRQVVSLDAIGDGNVHELVLAGPCTRGDDTGECPRLRASLTILPLRVVAAVSRAVSWSGAAARTCTPVAWRLSTGDRTHTQVRLPYTTHSEFALRHAHAHTLSTN